MALDTGTQVRGWSVDEAERFFFKDPLTKFSQRGRNVFTFAADIPGASLSYWQGYKAFRSLRQVAEMHGQGRFDIRAFHHAILRDGSIPFDVLTNRMRRRGFLAQA